MNIDVCLSPLLYPTYHKSDAVVVVVDVFRATTTMAVAFSNGARSILPVSTTEEAESYKTKGFLVGAERKVVRCPFADFGNSPFDYISEKVQGKDVVFTTTNGTRAITIASQAAFVVTGAFVNLSAVATYCLVKQRDVIVLCSGWNNTVCAEDSLFAGALVNILLQQGFSLGSDAARIVGDQYVLHQSDLLGYLKQTDHYARLAKNHLLRDVDCCLDIDKINIIPQLNREDKKLYPHLLE